MSNVSYPYDDSGHASTNLIKGEIQVLTLGNNTPYRYFIPTFAPFYETNFKLIGRDALGNERELIRNVDYNFNLTFIGATRGNGAAVWGGVNIINQTIQGPVKLDYQCLGGRYSADRDLVVRTIAENNYNPRVIAWDQVTSIQELFPPSRHPQDLDTFTGYRDLIDAIQNYQDHPDEFQILKDLIWNHMLDVNDPHETLKLLGEYVKRTELQEQVNRLDDRIDTEHRLIEKNISDINDLKNRVVSDGNNYQSQIDANRNNISILDKSTTDRFNELRILINGNTTNITRNKSEIDELRGLINANKTLADAGISGNRTLINQNKTDIDELKRLVNTNKTLADTGIANNRVLINQNKTDIDTLRKSVNTNTDRISTLDTRVTNINTAVNNRIDILNTKVDNLKIEVTVLDTAPSNLRTFITNVLIVKQPHYRYFVWMDSQGMYVRAPWHRPGMLSYSYHNPGSILGYLPVRGDITYNKANYPDLCTELGLGLSGNFSLVEMRGEFLRVLDNGRGIDINRGLRGFQTDANRSHNHSGSAGDAKFGTDGNTFTVLGPSNWAGGGLAALQDNGSWPVIRPTTALNHTHDLTIDYSGASESRPRNIAVPLWISY